MLVLLLAMSARAGKKRKKRGPSASTAAAMQHHQRGTMDHVHGDFDGAKEAFREAVKLKPDFAYAYFRLGFVMHEQEQTMKCPGDHITTAPLHQITIPP